MNSNKSEIQGLAGFSVSHACSKNSRASSCAYFPVLNRES